VLRGEVPMIDALAALLAFVLIVVGGRWQE
jgi:hypothetical protein